MNDDFCWRSCRDSDLLKKWVTDSNVVAQEKGVEALSTLVRESGENSAKWVYFYSSLVRRDCLLTLDIRLRADILPSIVEKCFGSARASLKIKAIEIALLWIEVENTGEGVVVSPSHHLAFEVILSILTIIFCMRGTDRRFKRARG